MAKLIYLVAVASLSVLQPVPQLLSRGDTVEPEWFGDQFDAHLKAGNIEVVKATATQSEPEKLAKPVTMVVPEPAKKTATKKAEPTPAPEPEKLAKPVTMVVPATLAEVPGLDAAMLSALESADVTNVDQLALLTVEELMEIAGISEERATEILTVVKPGEPVV